jgi:L-rhamnose mutarotase
MCFTTELRPEKAAEYRLLHDAVWPGVQQRIRDCNIQNYSIFLQEGTFAEDPSRLLLIGYLEYTGADWTKDMEAMAADAETQRWWALTAPCQRPLPNAETGKTWSEAKCIMTLI